MSLSGGACVMPVVHELTEFANLLMTHLLSTTFFEKFCSVCIISTLVEIARIKLFSGSRYSYHNCQ